jgi:hypothetical protein
LGAHNWWGNGPFITLINLFYPILFTSFVLNIYTRKNFNFLQILNKNFKNWCSPKIGPGPLPRPRFPPRRDLPDPEPRLFYPDPRGVPRNPFLCKINAKSNQSLKYSSDLNYSCKIFYFSLSSFVFSLISPCFWIIIYVNWLSNSYIIHYIDQWLTGLLNSTKKKFRML